MFEIYVRVISLPAGINGMTVPMEDGDYNVYLNASLSGFERLKTFEHEMVHIREDHFSSDLPTKILEYLADNNTSSAEQ